MVQVQSELTGNDGDAEAPSPQTSRAVFASLRAQVFTSERLDGTKRPAGTLAMFALGIARASLPRSTAPSRTSAAAPFASTQPIGRAPRSVKQ
jgi:hypothetical protein